MVRSPVWRWYLATRGSEKGGEEETGRTCIQSIFLPFLSSKSLSKRQNLDLFKLAGEEPSLLANLTHTFGTFPAFFYSSYGCGGKLFPLWAPVSSSVSYVRDLDKVT